MTIQALCDAVANYYRDASIRRWIEEENVSPNDFDPVKKVRPIDIAAQGVTTRMLDLLFSLNANLARTPEQKAVPIHNILINACLADKSSERSNIFKWLMQPDKLALLQDEGIHREHILAAMGEKPAYANLDVEDADGLLPAYYAALTGNPHLADWLPENLQEDFFNRPIEKGIYQQSTGAWWACSSRSGTDAFLRQPMGVLLKTNLLAAPIHGYIAGVSILSQLIRHNKGKDFISQLPDEIFNNIDWNSQLKFKPECTEASIAWFLASGSSNQYIRLFKLPYEKLSQIDWNNSPGKHDEQHGITVAYGISELASGQKLLLSLPHDILNKINWATKPKLPRKKMDKRIIHLIMDPSFYLYDLKPLTLEQVKPAFFTLLNNLTLESITNLYNDLDNNDIAFPYVAIEFLKKLSATIVDQDMISQNYTTEEIQNFLMEIAIIFNELKNVQENYPFLNKKINGLKGHIIYQMSLTDSSANALLNLPNSFIKTDSTYLNNIENSKVKVKIIAQRYLLRGEKQDKIQGVFITHSLFQRINLLNQQLEQNNPIKKMGL